MDLAQVEWLEDGEGECEEGWFSVRSSYNFFSETLLIKPINNLFI